MEKMFFCGVVDKHKIPVSIELYILYSQVEINNDIKVYFSAEVSKLNDKLKVANDLLDNLMKQ